MLLYAKVENCETWKWLNLRLMWLNLIRDPGNLTSLWEINVSLTRTSQERFSSEDCGWKQANVAGQMGLKTQMLHKNDMLAWWVGSGDTSHVYKDLSWFEEFEPVEDGKCKS